MKTDLVNIHNEMIAEHSSSMLKPSTKPAPYARMGIPLLEVDLLSPTSIHNEAFLVDLNQVQGALRPTYSVSKDTFFEKLANVYQQKGLAMNKRNGLQVDLFGQIPSFVDEAPLNSGVKFLDLFERGKAVTLNMDPIDKQFMGFVQKMIMLWASESGDQNNLNNVRDLYEKVVDLQGLPNF